MCHTSCTQVDISIQYKCTGCQTNIPLPAIARFGFQISGRSLRPFLCVALRSTMPSESDKSHDSEVEEGDNGDERMCIHCLQNFGNLDEDSGTKCGWYCC